MRAQLIICLLILTTVVVSGLDITSNQVTLTATCLAWDKTGSWDSATNSSLLELSQSCSLASSSDVYFTVGANNFAKSNEPAGISLNVILEILDSKGGVAAVLIEASTQVGSAYFLQYTIQDPAQTLIWAQTAQIPIAATEFIFLDTTTQIASVNETIPKDVPAKTGMASGNTICSGSSWTISFSESASYLSQIPNRWILLAAVSLKSVRDVDRYSDGTVADSNCPVSVSINIGVIAGPVIAGAFVIGVIVVIILIARGRIKNGKCCRGEGDLTPQRGGCLCC